MLSLIYLLTLVPADLVCLAFAAGCFAVAAGLTCLLDSWFLRRHLLSWRLRSGFVELLLQLPDLMMLSILAAVLGLTLGRAVLYAKVGTETPSLRMSHWCSTCVLPYGHLMMQ